MRGIYMRSLFKTLFLLFLLSCGIFGQDPGKISGTVHLGTEETVLHQVSVRIAELKLSTVTDTYGHYEFANVPPGRYTVTAHQEGFTDSVQKIQVAGDAT